MGSIVGTTYQVAGITGSTVLCLGTNYYIIGKSLF